MNNDQIIEMAKQARLKDWWDSGNEHYETFTEHLHTFAQLVRNAALEEAAKVCESEYDNWDNERPIRLCVNAIRIRKS